MINLAKAIFSPTWLGVWAHLNAHYFSFQQAMAQEDLRTHFTCAFTIRKQHFSSVLLNFTKIIEFSKKLLFEL
jgi:hypothetical protein